MILLAKGSHRMTGSHSMTKKFISFEVNVFFYITFFKKIIYNGTYTNLVYGYPLTTSFVFLLIFLSNQIKK